MRLSRANVGNGKTDGSMLLGWWNSTVAHYNLNAGTVLAENGSVILGFDGEAYLDVGVEDGDPDSPTLLRAKCLTENKTTAG